MARKKTATRRGNNEGCITQKTDGSWVAVVSNGYDVNGKRLRQYFYGKSRAEVAVKMTTALSANLKGGHASIVNDDFQTLMGEWLFTFKKASVSARTFERNFESAKLHVFPIIGGLKLSEITTPVVQRLLNKMQLDGYALATIKKAKFIMNQFFEYAVDSQFVDSNPVSKIKLQSRERKVVTEEEYKAIPIDVRQKFLDILKKSDILRPICMTSMFAGLRIGEILALRWKDIDFDNKSINIDYAITQLPKFDKTGKVISRETVISDTKTAASVREVPMPNILIETLDEWKKTRWVLGKKTGISFIEPNDLVFSTNEGKLRTYWGIRAMFERLMRDNGMSEYGIHFHTLRHTYSSMLFEAGENPKVIQMLLGHKDVTTTIKTYNSVDRSYFRQATDKLDGKFTKKEITM